MRSSDDLFRRRQILRDQLSDLKLLRLQVMLAEKRSKYLGDDAVTTSAVGTKFAAVSRQSLIS